MQCAALSVKTDSVKYPAKSCDNTLQHTAQKTLKPSAEKLRAHLAAERKIYYKKGRTQNAIHPLPLNFPHRLSAEFQALNQRVVSVERSALEIVEQLVIAISPRREWKSFLFVERWFVRWAILAERIATCTSHEPVSPSLRAYSFIISCLFMDLFSDIFSLSYYAN